MGSVNEWRWKLSEYLFRLAYRACPDRKAFDFVMKHGIDKVRAARTALPKEGNSK